MIAKLLIFTMLFTLLICGSSYSDVSDYIPSPDMLEKMETQRWSYEATLLIVPVNPFIYDKDGKATINWSLQEIMGAFQRMYPNAELSTDLSRLTDADVTADTIQSILPSMLLTMAHKQGYRIEIATSTYLVLIKYED